MTVCYVIGGSRRHGRKATDKRHESGIMPIRGAAIAIVKSDRTATEIG
jgi:hypothetical protein